MNRTADMRKILMAFALTSAATPLFSQVGTPPTSYALPADDAPYADVADLVTIAPLIVDAQIAKATKVAPEQSIGVPANLQRMLIEANVLALIQIGRASCRERV